ncbi:MAG TPA: TldD/PmbA family protein [Thermoanaerobaculia bacterium]|jgi:predicted Zn-dependent protease
MRNERDSYDILDAALARALRLDGVTEADAVFMSADQNISRFANSQLHQNMSEESAWLTLRVVAGASMGVATTTVFDDDELARTAELARESARHAGELPKFAGLYRGDEPVPQLDTYDEATAQLSPATKAQSLREMFDRGRERGVEFAGVYSTGGVSVAAGNSHGVRRWCRVTSADATVIAITPTSSGYATRRERRNEQLDLAALGDEATLKATLCLETQQQLEPGTYDVILEPPALSEVFEWLNMIALTGQSFEDGSSFFVGNLGKRVLGENFTLTDDSLDEDFLPFPFDLEGMPRRRYTLIDQGSPVTPALDKAWADRLGMQPTASTWHLGSPEHGAAYHLAMAGGTSTREEMLRSTKLGIWVTRFNYVNGLLEPKTALMTGTTRDGTFLVRDGEVVARLPNLRWTQSMVEAFANIESLSAERHNIGMWFNAFGGTRAPVAKFRGWKFGS